MWQGHAVRRLFSKNTARPAAVDVP
jgi:hypothetical protein